MLITNVKSTHNATDFLSHLFSFCLSFEISLTGNALCVIALRVFVSKVRKTQKKQQHYNIENENLLIFEVIKPAVNAASLVVDVFPHPSGPINNTCPLFCVYVSNVSKKS